jgi:recombination protein RecT
MATTAAAVARKTETLPAEKEHTDLSMNQRFTEMVLREFNANTIGNLRITDYMRYLINGYFLAIDRMLKSTEEKRVKKNSSNRDAKYNELLAYVWNNVNMTDLALDVVYSASIGLDMRQDNHLFPIPFKNNRTQKYDITLMPGYNGIQYVAMKYALIPPLSVTTELVYSTDVFEPIKKNVGNKIESYNFAVANPFNRGEIVGAFGYIEYAEPAKNKLVIMSLADILKRKPKTASAEFWGGKKKEWQNGKQVEVDFDGWFAEMCLKTIKREVYSPKHIPRDPMKIDESYQHFKAQEARLAEMEAQMEIDAHANTILIDTEVIDDTPRPMEADVEPEPAPAPRNVDMETGEILDQSSLFDSAPMPEPEPVDAGPGF